MGKVVFNSEFHKNERGQCSLINGISVSPELCRFLSFRGAPGWFLQLLPCCVFHPPVVSREGEGCRTQAERAPGCRALPPGVCIHCAFITSF